jgi:isopenicillin-N N-acyltransferase-like protein
MQVQPFPLIELAGPPEARGRAYGQQATERIRKGIAHYGAQLGAGGASASRIRRLALDFVPRIEAFAPHFVPEMQGVAAGANVEFADIVLLNCRTEVLQLARRNQDPDPDAGVPDGCTGAIILPEASADGVLIHGQNWDWKHECVETTVVLRIRRDDGPDLLTMVEAGGLARCGMNSAGLAITANYLRSDRDYLFEGVPLSLLRRLALEQEQVALALRILHTTPKSASNNLMLSHASGFGVDIECAPDESFTLWPERGVLVHANHFVSPVALAKLKDGGIATTPDSLYRDRRVRQLLEPHIGRLTIEHLRAAFLDDWQSPWSVCRPPRKNLEDNLSATVAMVLMRPAEGHMEIAPLPALNRRFTTYTLAGAPGEAPAEQGGYAAFATGRGMARSSTAAAR